MQLNHKPLIGLLYRPIFGPGQNSISVSPPFSLRFSHPDPIKTENALAACYLIFRFPTGLFKIIIFDLFTLFFTIIFIFFFCFITLYFQLFRIRTYRDVSPCSYAPPWDTPLYGPYRNVPLDRVWLLTSLS